MKSVVVMLVALASLGVVGCGDQKTEVKPAATTAAAAPTTSASGTPAAKAAPAATGGW